MDWIHPSSGRVYNTIKSPPQSMIGPPNNPSNMIDDITNEPLIQVIFFFFFSFIE